MEKLFPKSKRASVFLHKIILQAQQNFFRVPAIGEQPLRIFNQFFHLNKETDRIFAVYNSVIVR